MTFKKPKVLVVGSGGVGTISALGLCLNDRAEVVLVVRSDHDYIKSNGFTIKSKSYGNIDNWKPHHLARSVFEASEKHGEFDFIVLTTKNIPDGPITCEQIIEPAVTTNTTIVLVQNGIGIEKPMIERFPNNVVLSGVSLIGSSYKNGVVENLGKDTVYLGVFKNPNIENYEEKAFERLESFYSIYQNDDDSKNKVIIDKTPEKSRWEKLVYNSVLNTTTALVNLDVNRCQINDANEKIFKPAMDEMISIAASEGYDVSNVKDKFIHLGDGLFYSPSMCIDVRKNQLIELEVILGNPLKVAAKNGVPTPVLSMLYNLLVMVQFRIKEDIGLVKIDPKDYAGDSDEYPSIYRQK